MAANNTVYDQDGKPLYSTGPPPGHPEPVSKNNDNLLVEAQNNNENPTLSFDVSEFDPKNEAQVIEMQKYLTSKGYDLGDLGENNAGGLDYWGTKSNQAYSQYAGTYEEDNTPVVSESADASETIDDGEEIHDINAISDEEDGSFEEVVTNASNSGKQAADNSPLAKLSGMLGDAWGAFKEGGYKNMDAKVFNGHLPFGPKPYDLYQQKNNTVDGVAETAITESNEAVTTAGGGEEEDPKKNPFADFKWQSAQYGNYK